MNSDNSTVVYKAQQDSALYDLYSVPITGGTPVKLNAPLPAGEAVWDFTLDPAGSMVVYRAIQTVIPNPPGDPIRRRELFAVPIGGGTPVKVSGTIVDGGGVTSGNYLIR